MGAMDPRLPDYDAQTYREARWPEKLRMACQDWVVNGFGNPFPVYFFYPFKLVVLWLLPWMFFCSMSAEVDSMWALSSYAFTATAFQKAILWNLFFEVFGLGCASGPLSGHYNPPFGGAPHFLRPGTIKAPLFEKLPLIGGHKRTVFDVALYVALLAVLLRGLLASQIDPLSHVLPAVVMLFAFGVLDKTVFLAARAEHYLTAAVCLLSADWRQGLMWVWAAVWFWAGVSKLTRHFPAVVASMHATSPLTYFLPGVKRAMYRDHPDDLNPSRLAKVIAHLGTINELAIPFLLLFSPSPEVTLVGLALMVWLHLFVTSNVPLGVPIEWNAMMVYGGFFLFYGAPSAFAFTLNDPFLIAYLVVAIGLVQLVGNIAPKYVSFLLSMRYYAGNWAYSTWLFRGDSIEKLDEHIKKSALTTRAQLIEMDMYDDDTLTLMMSKLPVFRFMHFQGRMMHTLVPQAVGGIEHVDEYEQHDGENIATLVLGWSFGDGHLHQEQLLRAIQAECDFEDGELRCVFVESQPLFKQACAWRIVDAKRGELARGEMRVSEMMKRQPWPEVRGETG